MNLDGVEKIAKDYQEQFDNFVIEVLNKYDIPITRDNTKEFIGIIKIKETYYDPNLTKYEVMYCEKVLCEIQERRHMINNGDNSYTWDVVFEATECEE